MKITALNKGNTINKKPLLSWPDAKNILISKGFRSVSNEDGFIPDIPIDVQFPALNPLTAKGYSIIGAVSINNTYVIFLTNNSRFVIVSKDNDNIAPGSAYDVKLNTSTIKARRDRPFEIVFDYTQKGERIIAFTDNFLNPYILNIDNPPFQLDVNKELVDPSKIEYAKLFPNYRTPSFSGLVLRKYGGTLPAGVYYLSLCYHLDDNNTTSWCKPSRPIYITSVDYDLTDILFLPTQTRSRSQQGEIAGYSFEAEITELDAAYNSFSLCLIQEVNGVTNSYLVGKFPIDPVSTSSRVTVDSIPSISVAPEEVLIPSFTSKTVKTLAVADRELLLANYEITDIKYQKYANNIKLKWVLQKDINPTFQDINSDFYFSNSGTAFMCKGMQPDEVYSIYIHLLLDDGSITEGFHIPGLPAESFTADNKVTEFDASLIGVEYDAPLPVGDPNYLNGFPGTNYFHFYDTSNLSTRQFGFWENADEVYPDTEDFDIWDSSGSTGQTLRNLKVRHHKTPSEISIYQDGVNIVDDGFYRIGLEAEDIFIPDEILPRVKGFFFSYAVRTEANCTVLGQSIGVDHSHLNNVGNRPTKVVRLYDYPLLCTKIGISPAYLKAVFAYDGVNTQNTITPDFTTTSADYVGGKFVVKVLESEYIPPNNNAVKAPGNDLREEHFRCRLGVEWNPMTGYSSIFVGGKAFVVNICALKRNIYQPFYQQNLASTDKIYYTAGVNNYDTIANGTYGFDTFSQAYSVTLARFAPNDPGAATTPTVTQSSVEYSAYDRFISFGYSRYNQQWSQRLLVDKAEVEKFPFYVYSLDYAALNNKLPHFPYNPFAFRNDRFTKVVRRSLKNNVESNFLGLRKFLANNYKEISQSKGEIWSLKAENEIVYIQTEFSLFVASIKDRLFSLISEVYLGKGDIFDREPKEVIPTPEGYIGCKSQWGNLICKHGYIVVDREVGRVILVSALGPQELIDPDNREYFGDNLNTFVDKDNPFTEEGAVLGFDNQNNRLIVSTRKYAYIGSQEVQPYNPAITYPAGTIVFDGTSYFTIVDLSLVDPDPELDYIPTGNENLFGRRLMYQDTSLFEDVGNTYSYSFDFEGLWVCRHDYKPNYFILSRKNLFVISNYPGLMSVFRHNYPIARKGIYEIQGVPSNVAFPSYVDVLFNIGDLTKDSLFFEAIKWSTSVIDSNGINIQDLTITHIMVYNETQCSGMIDLKDKRFKLIRDVEGHWNFNDFRDLVANPLQRIFNDREELNTANIDLSKAFYRKGKFIGKSLVVRFQYDNIDQNTVYLHDTNVVVRTSNR